jgi:3D (Asp-Asp-Asp) domain-containing protein
MPKSLNLTIIVGVGLFLVGCAEQSVLQKPVAAVVQANSHLGRMSNVRTTAYTRVENGGRRNALGKYLSGHHVMSAASDWSVFPLGTRFRICSTREEFIIDDYGTALVGTSTIDLYKPTKLEMKRWGVRNVDIDVLQWGSPEKSLQVLGPRMKYPQVQKMVAALQTNASATSVTLASNTTKTTNVVSGTAQSSAKRSTSKQTSSRNSASRTLD